MQEEQLKGHLPFLEVLLGSLKVLARLIIKVRVIKILDKAHTEGIKVSKDGIIKNLDKNKSIECIKSIKIDMQTNQITLVKQHSKNMNHS